MSPAPPRVYVKDGPKGRELRVDGSLASWYRPGSPSTGGVWDALAAPIAALPRNRRRRVLILGLGGGSVARMVRVIAPEARIVGVEIDREVVEVARRELDLGRLGVEVVVEDAQLFLERDRHRYDAIIEDVFEGGTRWIRKPAWLLEHGLRLAAARLWPSGILVSNTIHETAAVEAVLRDVSPHLVSIGVRGFWNRILACGEPVPTALELRRRLKALPAFAEALPELRFRTPRPGRPRPR